MALGMVHGPASSTGAIAAVDEAGATTSTTDPSLEGRSGLSHRHAPLSWRVKVCGMPKGRGPSTQHHTPGPDAVEAHARWFVALFLSLLIVSAVGSLNLWPFSSWDLFSGLRTDRQTGWGAVAVDSAGVDRDYPISSLRRGTEGFGPLMTSFGRRSEADRTALCATWLNGADKLFGPGVQAVHIDRLTRFLSDRSGPRPATPQRMPAWTCTAGGARAA